MTGFVSFSSSTILALPLILMISGFVAADTTCIVGFQSIGGDCYKISLSPAVTWHEAKALCAKDHGQLAILKTKSQIDALVAHLNAAQFAQVGFEKNKGVWRYVNGDPVNIHLWGPNEPSGDGTCGVLLNAHAWDRNWKGWQFNDEPCNSKHGFICQNPCPAGFQFIGNSCYKLHLNRKMTWINAMKTCEKEHGRLAVLMGRSQINALAPHLSADKKQFPYVGHYNVRFFGWHYVNARRVNTHLWGPHEPSGDGRCGNLLNAHKWDAAWNGWHLNDVPCDKKRGFICENPCIHGFQYIGGHCYTLHLTYDVTFGEAEYLCSREHAKLAVIKWKYQITALTPHLDAANVQFAHVGLRKDRAGVWRYENGNLMNRDLWGPNEPSGDGACGVLLNAHKGKADWKGWHINDEPCNKMHGFICEAPCPVGFQYIGSWCFKLNLNSAVTWSEAKDLCAEEHAQLAILWQEAEIYALAPYLDAANVQFVHVGLEKDKAGVWRYVDSFPVNQRLWGPGGPSGDGTCGVLQNAHKGKADWKGWHFNNEPCDKKHGFICRIY